jgi:hypothetical protein
MRLYYTKIVALIIVIAILSITIQWTLNLRSKDYENSKQQTRLYFQDGSRCIEGIYVNTRNDAVVNVGGTPYLTPINYCPIIIALMKGKNV